MPPIDAGPTEVSCGLSNGPTLVVTRPSSGSSGASTTLLRLTLQFRGGATGVRLGTVVHRTVGRPGTDVRTWAVTDLHAPEGFSGSVPTTMGNPAPTVLWTATAPALDAETMPCDRPAPERTGIVHVEGTTDAGPFTVDCALGQGAGLPFMSLGYACARGVAGWLPTDLGTGTLSSIHMPVTAAIASSRIMVHNTGGGAVTGFVATGATVTPRFAGPVFPGLMCALPAVWEIPPGGMHTLWRGTSSSETWSGPAAPGAEADANWMWQLVGATVPMGLCNVPFMGGDPSHMCPSVSLQFTLRGTSSAGAWEWEGAPFSCYEMPMR